jgi:hypothetical protein
VNTWKVQTPCKTQFVLLLKEYRASLAKEVEGLYLQAFNNNVLLSGGIFWQMEIVEKLKEDCASQDGHPNDRSSLPDLPALCPRNPLANFEGDEGILPRSSSLGLQAPVLTLCFPVLSIVMFFARLYKWQG